MRNKIMGLWAFGGMLVLILDSGAAVAAARDGVSMCLSTVIPSLFPFIILSLLLTRAFQGVPLPVLRPIGTLLGIPSGMEGLLVCAFLGGYPVGAQAAAEAYRNGALSREDAQRLLSFCSNAGPAFLFGMGTALFPHMWMCWALWGIHVLSALMAGALLPRASGIPSRKLRTEAVSLTGAMASGLRVMGTICGWVVLFRILLSAMSRWFGWLLPVPVQVGFSGLMELSNGCCELARIPDISLRFLLCSGILAFGGLCVAMQTLSVTQGLSLRYYFRGKLLQTLFSLLMALAVVHPGKWMVLWAGAVICMFLVKGKKSSSIPDPAGV